MNATITRKGNKVFCNKVHFATIYLVHPLARKGQNKWAYRFERLTMECPVIYDNKDKIVDVLTSFINHLTA